MTKEATVSTEANTHVINMMLVLDRGHFMINLGRETQSVIDAVVDTNKEGTINIKLRLMPSGYDRDTGGATQVDVVPTISTVIPRHNVNKSIFFVAQNNVLTRDDPAQAELFGR